MTDANLSKAEKNFFHPDDVIEYGIPERCSNCPPTNQSVSMANISKAFLGDAGLSGMMGDYLTKKRQEEKAQLVTRAEGCTGCERLTDEDVASIVADNDLGDGYGDVSSRAGFRCAATGEIAIATTFVNGVVGLNSLNSLSEQAV